MLRLTATLPAIFVLMHCSGAAACDEIPLNMGLEAIRTQFRLMDGVEDIDDLTAGWAKIASYATDIAIAASLCPCPAAWERFDKANRDAKRAANADDVEEVSKWMRRVSKDLSDGITHFNVCQMG